MTRFIGLVGYPLKHSVSPQFQQAALDYYRLDINYEASKILVEACIVIVMIIYMSAKHHCHYEETLADIKTVFGEKQPGEHFKVRDADVDAAGGFKDPAPFF